MNCHFRWTNSTRNDRFKAFVKRTNPCIHLKPYKNSRLLLEFRNKCINFWQKCHDKMLKSNLISLNRCLGSLLLLFTTRWWSSRFERQEAHELTNQKEDALWYTGHAKSWESNSPKKPPQLDSFWHSATLRVPNLSTHCLWKWQNTPRLQNKRARKSPCSTFLL